MLVITASLTLGWVPRWSVRACITLNGLVLSLTKTINLSFRCRGVHGSKLCLESFFSARWVPISQELKVVSPFLLTPLWSVPNTKVFRIISSCTSSGYPQSCLCNEGVRRYAILFEITEIESVNVPPWRKSHLFYQSQPSDGVIYSTKFWSNMMKKISQPICTRNVWLFAVRFC